MMLTHTDTTHHVTSAQSINSLNIEPCGTEPKNRKCFDNLSLNCVLDACTDIHWKPILNGTHAHTKGTYGVVYLSFRSRFIHFLAHVFFEKIHSTGPKCLQYRLNSSAICQPILFILLFVGWWYFSNFILKHRIHV